MTSPNSKHIDVRHQILRERVANREFEVVHVPSAEQRVHFLTKRLHTKAFRLSPHHGDKLMVIPLIRSFFRTLWGIWLLGTGNWLLGYCRKHWDVRMRRVELPRH